MVREYWNGQRTWRSFLQEGIQKDGSKPDSKGFKIKVDFLQKEGERRSKVKMDAYKNSQSIVR